MSKGSSKRPTEVDNVTFESNWDMIFKNKRFPEDNNNNKDEDMLQVTQLHSVTNIIDKPSNKA